MSAGRVAFSAMSNLVKDCFESMKERRGCFDVYRLGGGETDRLLGSLLPNPDVVLSRGEAVVSRWKSKSTEKVRIEVDGRSYFLKRYNRGGCFYGLKNIFRPSKALRSWRATQLFLKYEIPTLPPLLCLEERYFSLLGRAYLLLPFLCDGSDNLLSMWPSLTVEEQKECVVKLAKIISTMHMHGIVHGDLNWRNILVSRAKDGFQCYLVDLDDTRILHKPTSKDFARDMDHFVRDMKRSRVPKSISDIFWAGLKTV